jgi:branched-chain amino acid transport system ATP-binding protein
MGLFLLSGTKPLKLWVTTMSENTELKDQNSILKIDDVTKNFGGLTAIDSINFQIDRGELLGLIGPNGSGKSTLFKLIFGVHNVSGGAIQFKNELISSGLSVHEIANRGVAQFYQESTLMLDMSTRDNVRLSMIPDTLRSFHGSREHDARIERILELTELSEVADVNAEDLTHKNKQKLELAKAVVREPELLLLDEPFAGLTKDEANEIIDIIAKMNEEGMTICIVDHNLQWLRSFVERIIVLHDGNIIAKGSPDTIVENEDVQTAYIGEHGSEEQ